MDKQEATDTLARSIRTRARAQGITLTRLWTDVGLSKQQFFNRLIGESDWRITELLAIAERLDCTLDDLTADPIERLNRRGDLLTPHTTWGSVSAAWLSGTPLVAA